MAVVMLFTPLVITHSFIGIDELELDAEVYVVSNDFQQVDIIVIIRPITKEVFKNY